MCGRTAVSLDRNNITRACRYRNRDGRRIQPRWRNPGGTAGGGTTDSSAAKSATDNYKKGYNVSPGSLTPILVSADHLEDSEDKKLEDEKKEEDLDIIIEPMKWGLIPSWHKGETKEFSYKTSNARSDGILQKRFYKQPLDKGRRCVVIADGYYEWKTDPKTKAKQPYFIYFPKAVKTDPENVKDTEDDCSSPRLLTMAGIFERSYPKESEEPLYSYTIITTDASPELSKIHHRMPAILDGDTEVLAWLNHGQVPLKDALNLIKPKSCLSYHPVSSFVNKVQNDSEECVKEVELSKKSASGNLMANWLKKSENEDEPSKKSRKTE